MYFVCQFDVGWFQIGLFYRLVCYQQIEVGMQGLKRKRRCQIECKDHLFSIQSLKPNSSKYDTKLLFCPKFQRDPLPPQFIHPEFNLDFKYYTSAFILGVDKRVLLKNQQQEIMDHQKQIRDSLQKHNQLIFPRPNSKHTHCSVCKEHYKNYYLHISSEEHRQRISISFYNFHIKEICKIYSHFWEGSEEKADLEAQRLALQQQQRRQKISQLVQDGEQQSSLLDVQRGEINQFFFERYEDGEDYQQKSSKKMSRPLSVNDDTLPLRAYKRSGPSGRTYQSQYLRKKFHHNNLTAQRMHRERQEKRYQRERQKIKTDRDNQSNQQLIKINQKQGDVFIIMKASYAIAQGHGEFIWKRRPKITKEIQKINLSLQNRERSQASPQRQTKKIQIHFDKEAELQKKTNYQKRQQQNEMKPYKYSHYPRYPHQYQKDQKVDYSKSQHQYRPIDKNSSQPYKHPYYYNHYTHYDHYPRQKPYEYSVKQKERHKLGQKQEYDYHSMPYQWPYQHPYYMPPTTQPAPNPHDPSFITNSKNQPPGPSYPAAGNTNININFPMYMCPPQSSYSATNPHPPINPYMGYQYPYGPHPHSHIPPGQQPNPNPRDPNPPIPHSAYPPYGYPPPPHYKQQSRIIQQQKQQPSNSQPINHQPYPYMHHYPPYQYPPHPPQKQNNNHLSKF